MSTTLKIIIGIVVLIVSFTIIQRCTTPEYIETTTEKVVVDSAKVDSLTSVIKYLESIPPDTVKLKVPIPIPVEADGTLTYQIPYTDSLISALWTVEALGEITEFDFEYYQKRRLVRETNTTITEQVFLTKLKTITRTKQNRAYLSIGADLGISKIRYSFSPKVSYTLKSGETFSARYDILNDEIGISYMRPIRFKLPF